MRLTQATTSLAIAALVAIAAPRPPLAPAHAAPQRPAPAAAARAAAAPAVEYDVAFPNAVHHEARITATFSGLGAAPLELRMSRSSPGRYALHEFAKNVYAVEATDGGGRALDVVRPDPYGWTVPRHGAVVRVTYTLFADRAGGTYSGIDRTHAHLNMPATFMWARGLQERPIRVRFRPLAGWKIATQLPPAAGAANTFTAPDLQYFMDSPTELSDHDVREWTVESGGRTQTIRVALHHAGTAAELDRYVELAKRVVRAEMGVFGELPAYDYGTYTFIAGYLPYVSGDGMEHRNSTSLTSTRSLADATLPLVSTLAHEYFHSWNMERIRAREIEPFDFERANMSPELWFGEGFTNYYDGLSLRRAGITSVDDFAADESRAVNTVVNAPGRAYHSAAGMSRLAPFVDAASSIDPTNFANTFISYYTWGDAIGLGLDLTLRTRSPARTLDDLMRAMWRKFGKTGVPYTMDDLRRTLGEVAGDTAFANDFFRRYITGHAVVDYAALLGRFGLLLRRSDPSAAWIGAEGRGSRIATRLEFSDGAATVAGPTLVGEPLYDAGIDRGDRILTLDGVPLASAEALRGVLGRHQPGDTVDVVFEQRMARRTAAVVLGADPDLEIVTYEAAGKPLSPGMRELRRAWLGGEDAADAKPRRSGQR